MHTKTKYNTKSNKKTKSNMSLPFPERCAILVPSRPAFGLREAPTPGSTVTPAPALVGLRREGPGAAPTLGGQAFRAFCTRGLGVGAGVVFLLWGALLLMLLGASGAEGQGTGASALVPGGGRQGRLVAVPALGGALGLLEGPAVVPHEIGRASCRDRV